MPGLALLAVSGLLAATAGCGGRSRSTEGSPQGQRTALLGYLREIEPLRLAVNRLLNGADPILADYARGGRSRSTEGSPQSQRTALLGYLREIEPLRLAVNWLLNGADPILADDARGRLSARATSLRMGALEARFAAYTVDIAAIEPATPGLRGLHALYAHTYILEDSYLSALVVGLAERDVANLPNTQSEQRAAIIQWRTGLAVLAGRLRVVLPGDLHLAGRGEIAPSPHGS